MDLASLVGRYDLYFGPLVSGGYWEGTGEPGWEGVHALFEVVEQDGVLRAIVTPDWYASTDDGATVSIGPDGGVVLDFGVTVNEWGDAAAGGPWVDAYAPRTLDGTQGRTPAYGRSFDVRDILGSLELAVVNGTVCDGALARIFRNVLDCDEPWLFEFSQRVTVAIDQTPPQLRVAAYEAGPRGSVLPFEPLEVQGTEIDDLSLVLDCVQFSDEAATGDAVTATLRIADSPPTYAFADWSAVAGTNQLLLVATPLVDASGNQSGTDQQLLPVLDVGAPLALHDFSDSGSVAVWGPTQLLSATTAAPGLCDEGGCFALGPYTDFEVGYPSVAGQVLTSGATLVRIRYRVFVGDYVGDFMAVPELSLHLYSADGSVEQLQIDATQPYTSWTDPEYDWLTRATDWSG